MAFTVMSNGFKDGDYLPNDFILSAELCLRTCAFYSGATHQGRLLAGQVSASPRLGTG